MIFIPSLNHAFPQPDVMVINFPREFIINNLAVVRAEIKIHQYLSEGEMKWRTNNKQRGMMTNHFISFI